jgi:hypothetical protein
MTRLNWEKARQRDVARTENKVRRRLTGEQRRVKKYGEWGAAIAAFALKHGIGCFVCTDKKPVQWAKSGWNRKGPWVLCLHCVKTRAPSGK